MHELDINRDNLAQDNGLSALFFLLTSIAIITSIYALMWSLNIEWLLPINNIGTPMGVVFASLLFCCAGLVNSSAQKRQKLGLRLSQISPLLVLMPVYANGVYSLAYLPLLLIVIHITWSGNRRVWGSLAFVLLVALVYWVAGHESSNAIALNTFLVSFALVWAFFDASRKRLFKTNKSPVLIADQLLVFGLVSLVFHLGVMRAESWNTVVFSAALALLGVFFKSQKTALSHNAIWLVGALLLSFIFLIQTGSTLAVSFLPILVLWLFCLVPAFDALILSIVLVLSASNTFGWLDEQAFARTSAYLIRNLVCTTIFAGTLLVLFSTRKLGEQYHALKRYVISVFICTPPLVMIKLTDIERLIEGQNSVHTVTWVSQHLMLLMILSWLLYYFHSYRRNLRLFADKQELQTHLSKLTMDATQVVALELNLRSGYATVISGESSWSSVWAHSKVSDVLEKLLSPNDVAAVERCRFNPGTTCEVSVLDPVKNKTAYTAKISFSAVYTRDNTEYQLVYRQNINDQVLEREKMEATLTQLRLTTDVGRIGLFMHDLKTDILEVNDEYRIQRDLPKEEYPVLHLCDVLSRVTPEQRDTWSRFLDTFIDSKEDSSQAQIKSVHRNAEVRDLKLTFRKLFRNEKLIAIAGSAVDITDEIQRESETRLLSQEKDKAIESLNIQLLRASLISKEARVWHFQFDFNSKCLLLSHELTQLFGVEGDDVQSFVQLGALSEENIRAKLSWLDQKLPLLKPNIISNKQIRAGEITKTAINTSVELEPIELITKRTKSVWLKIVATCYKVDTAPAQVFGCVIDVTDEVLAQQKSDARATELRAATEASRIHVIEENLTLGTGMLITSPSLYPTGTGSPIVGRALKKVVPKAFHEELRKCYNHEGYVAEFPIDLDILEEPFWVRQQVVRRFKRGQQEYAVLIATDVGEEHAINAKLQSSLNESKALVSELESQRERQRQMFAVIGHELRTPAATLQMLLADQGVGAMQPHGKAIDETTAHLLAVLNDLRSVVRSEGSDIGEIVIDRISAVVDRAITPLKPLFNERRVATCVSLTGLSDIELSGNFQALRQIVTNLTKNAALYSGGSDIWVSIDATLLEEQMVQLCLKVEDNGEGVSESLKSQMFTPFTRGKSSHDGTGLGLFICRDLARQMGGDLSYTDREKGGACFMVNIMFNLPTRHADSKPHTKPLENQVESILQSHPLAASPYNGASASRVNQADIQKSAASNTRPLKGKPNQTAESKSKPLEDKSVLIAEDNMMIRMLTRKLLENLGAEVVESNNGILALKQFNDKRFDLVISDIFMPELDGYGLCHAIRSHDMNIPIIGVTAATLGEEVDSMLTAGANQVISKPINSETLLTVLKELAIIA